MPNFDTELYNHLSLNRFIQHEIRDTIDSIQRLTTSDVDIDRIITKLQSLYESFNDTIILSVPRLKLNLIDSCKEKTNQELGFKIYEESLNVDRVFIKPLDEDLSKFNQVMNEYDTYVKNNLADAIIHNLEQIYGVH